MDEKINKTKQSTFLQDIGDLELLDKILTKHVFNNCNFFGKSAYVDNIGITQDKEQFDQPLHHNVAYFIYYDQVKKILNKDKCFEKG